MKNMEKRFKYIMAIAFSIFVCYTLISLYVMYSRYVNTESTDVNVHIHRALAGGGYSLNSFLIRWIDYIATFFNVNETYLFIAYNLLIIVFTVILLAISMQRVLLKIETKNPSFLHMLWLALLLQFTCIIHIPAIYPWFYRNVTNPNLSPLGTQPWNSDTYNLMRMFSGVALFYFIIIFKQSFRKQLSKRDLFLFALFLFLTNFAKPSFVVCFAPAACLVCLISLGENGYSGFWDYVRYGFAILLSLCCIPFQYERLYGENTGSGIIFTLERIESVNMVSLVGVLVLSIAFPIIATIYIMLIRKEKKIDYDILLAWLMYGISLFFRLFFAETGPRVKQNNFAFGNFIAAYFLFSILALKLYAITKKQTHRLIAIPWIVFGMHIISGIEYFVLIAQDLNTFF